MFYVVLPHVSLEHMALVLFSAWPTQCEQELNPDLHVTAEQTEARSARSHVSWQHSPISYSALKGRLAGPQQPLCPGSLPAQMGHSPLSWTPLLRAWGRCCSLCPAFATPLLSG